MAAFFLTTSALHIYVAWRQCQLARRIEAAIPRGELWMSPLSVSIMWDTLVLTKDKLDYIDYQTIRANLEEIEGRMANSNTYTLPEADAVRKWRRLRGLNVITERYRDSIADYRETDLGPDEMLVFATAATLDKPLLGPPPRDPRTLEFLARQGVLFVPLEASQTVRAD